jgi:hypothetical protein
MQESKREPEQNGKSVKGNLAKLAKAVKQALS